MKKTKIICTIGPASASYQILSQMAAAGMNIARLNFSHGNHQTHLSYLKLIRKLNQEENYNIKIMQDLEGFRIRIGNLPNPITLNKNEKIELFPAKTLRKQEKALPLDFSNFDKIPTNSHIYIDDGNIDLKIIDSCSKFLIAQVVLPGIVYSNKGVNIPSLNLQNNNIITDKDKTDIGFAVKHQVDIIAQSFVRNKQDIQNLKKLLAQKNYSAEVVAKIENRSGIDNIEAILPLVEGIMIARGDMGVLLPIYEVPVRQKQLLLACQNFGKFSIVATQMLESMKENLKPTRAEVSDVANAVWDKADYVMLSAETAIGKYPVETVQMMQQIIDYTYSFTS
ncbi:MAG: pyruvate kinase [Candidatus Cloacimonadota bacterium]|jgi:pyruvate kinase|nr:pyruvate kinase [Candidatus Cloacimonadota bacterium]